MGRLAERFDHLAGEDLQEANLQTRVNRRLVSFQRRAGLNGRQWINGIGFKLRHRHGYLSGDRAANYWLSHKEHEKRHIGVTSDNDGSADGSLPAVQRMREVVVPEHAQGEPEEPPHSDCGLGNARRHDGDNGPEKVTDYLLRLARDFRLRPGGLAKNHQSPLGDFAFSND